MPPAASARSAVVPPPWQSGVHSRNVEPDGSAGRGGRANRRSTPFGRPVVPLVNRTAITSSGRYRGSNAAGEQSAADSRRSVPSPRGAGPRESRAAPGTAWAIPAAAAEQRSGSKTSADVPANPASATCSATGPSG